MKQSPSHTIISDILTLMGISHELRAIDDGIGAVRFLIKTEEQNLLLAENGVRLAALSHIVKRIVERKREQEKRENATPFVIDVNEHQGKKIEEIKSKALVLAARARYFKSSVEMEPMTPYERMIVHAIFSGVRDIKTESTGAGKKRRVVLMYVAEGGKS